MEGLSGWVCLAGSARMGSAGPEWGQPSRAGRFGLTIHLRPPTLEDYNLFVQTLIRVFLDSMGSPLSQDFSHIHVEDIGK